MEEGSRGTFATARAASKLVNEVKNGVEHGAENTAAPRQTVTTASSHTATCATHVNAAAPMELTMRNIMRTFLDVLLPRNCAGCMTPSEVMCAHCMALLHEPQTFALAHSLLGIGYTCGSYERQIRHAILQWKDHADEECDRPFASALSDLFETMLTNSNSPPLNELLQQQPIMIVPAPSSRASLRRRGRAQMLPLASALARTLRMRGFNAHMADILVADGVRGKAVQVGSANARARRLQHGLRVVTERDRHWQADARAIIVDDIVTTGATLNRCASALDEAHIPTITAMGLARAPDRLAIAV